MNQQISDLKPHYEWVDFSKGICIIGVVVMYAGMKLESVGWLQSVIDFMQPFRMPDFFLISGLFLHRVLVKPWSEYLDKRVVHYVYYFLLWTLIFYLFQNLLVFLGLFSSEVPHDQDGLIFRLQKPYAMLWFIQLLPILCVFTRIFASVNPVIMLVFGVLIHTFPISIDSWVVVERFCERFIYFYCGYKFANSIFKLANWSAYNTNYSVIGLIVWSIINYFAVFYNIQSLPILSIILGITGALATVVIGANLAKSNRFSLVRYLGQQSLVIYLGFYLPMMCLIALITKLEPVIAPIIVINAGFRAVLICILSVASAIYLYKLTQGKLLSFLFSRPSWARLDWYRLKF